MRRLDALGHDLRAELAGERRERGGQRTAVAIVVDPVDQRLVELDDLGAQLEHVAEAGVARAGVVDGEVRAGGRPRLHGPAHRLVVEDHLGLAQLEHQPRAPSRSAPGRACGGRAAPTATGSRTAAIGPAGGPTTAPPAGTAAPARRGCPPPTPPPARHPGRPEAAPACGPGPRSPRWRRRSSTRSVGRRPARPPR